MGYSIIPGEKLFNKVPFVFKQKKNKMCSVSETQTGLFMKDGKFTEENIENSDILPFDEQVKYVKEHNLNFLTITFNIINRNYFTTKKN